MKEKRRTVLRSEGNTLVNMRVKPWEKSMVPILGFMSIQYLVAIKTLYLLFGLCWGIFSVFAVRFEVIAITDVICTG